MKLHNIPIEQVRGVVETLLKRNGGPISGADGNTYVMVRMEDFAVLEHYFNFANWEPTKETYQGPG